MTTILEALKNKMPKNSYGDFTTVWNYHSIKSYGQLLKNKRSNLHMLLSAKSGVFSDAFLKDGVTIFTGAKGRSAHSETEVVVFRGDHSDKGSLISKDGEYYSYEDLVEMGVR